MGSVLNLGMRFSSFSVLFDEAKCVNSGAGLYLVMCCFHDVFPERPGKWDMNTWMSRRKIVVAWPFFHLLINGVFLGVL